MTEVGLSPVFIRIGLDPKSCSHSLSVWRYQQRDDVDALIYLVRDPWDPKAISLYYKIITLGDIGVQYMMSGRITSRTV